jgi:hypothetical protein
LELIAVAPSNPTHVEEYLSTTPLPFPLYADPESCSFKALELKHGFFATMFSSKGIRAYKQAKQDGFKATGLKGSSMQLPGAFIASKDGSEFLWYHKAESSGEHAEPEDFFKAFDNLETSKAE